LILNSAKKVAAERCVQLVVMTFEPHPLAVLYPERAPGNLTPLALKQQLLNSCGVDCHFVLKSEAELLALSAQEFVEKYLVKGIKPSVVVEGEDFNFGAGRTGNIHTLAYLGDERGFEVVVVEPKVAKLSIGSNVRISSTMIRNMLTEGDVADAAIALDRYYKLIGQIVAGQGKGKHIGYPTANMAKPNQIVPAEGVYAGFAGFGDDFEQACKTEDMLPAALSIGRAKSVGADNPLMIEAHVLDRQMEDLTGKWMAMDFVKRIRSQIKFETEFELADQIAKDCEEVKKETE
jgi:riboflavin kinase/FMN adenylyltransferase